ncbi:hypothetical protein HKK72_25275 [Actinomadura sp. HBU206391]|nr:hypothetical protein [Actinomadura sp. HBU206391]
MWEIRSVRYSSLAGRVPVPALCRAFDGAGEAVLAAAGHYRASRREHAFRRLVQHWIRNADRALTPWFTHRLRDIADRPQTSDSTRAWVSALTPAATELSQPDRKPGHRPPAQAELRLASYSAAHTRYGTVREPSSVVNLALPPRPRDAADGPWRLYAIEIKNTSRFRLTTAAFNGPSRPLAVGDPETARSLSLHDNALSVSAEA